MDVVATISFCEAHCLTHRRRADIQTMIRRMVNLFPTWLIESLTFAVIWFAVVSFFWFAF
jgi:hypothetical protein